MLVAALLGLAAGVITGLTPGVHVNLVATLLLASAGVLARWFSPLEMGCFLIAMSVVHTFLDSLPSIFLGAPDSATALGVLPGHRYVLKGAGMTAVRLTLVGSLGGALLSVALFPVFLLIVGALYPLLRPWIGWLLLLVAGFMVVRDAKRGWALLVFLLSGCLGLLALDLPTLENPMFPLLSGLFGVSTLLYSLKETSSLPAQHRSTRLVVDGLRAGKAVVAGQASGFLTAMLPGVGSATAAVLSLQLVRNLGDSGYLVLQGSIGTVNFILSLATLLALGKARNGAVLAVKELLPVDLAAILVFLAVTLVAAGAGVVLALLLGKGFARLLSLVPYRGLVLGVILFLVALTPVLSGWKGVLVLAVSAAVGLIPATVRCARVHSMGCILVPVMSHFLL